MRLRNAIAALTVLSFGVMSTSFVLAHGGATGIVKERMDAMTAISKANKALGAMFKGAADYDPVAVRSAALEIKEHAGDAITELFPQGSNSEQSEALPAIWNDWATFESLAGDLAAYSQALADAAENPRDGQHMAGQGMMGQGMMQGGQSMMAGSGPDAAMLASMPPDAAYMHMTQTCSSCHTKFRKEKK